MLFMKFEVLLQGMAKIRIAAMLILLLGMVAGFFAGFELIQKSPRF